MLADLTRAMAGVAMAGTVTVPDAVTSVPTAVVAVAVPTLVTAPAFTSAWVVV